MRECIFCKQRFSNSLICSSCYIKEKSRLMELQDPEERENAVKTLQYLKDMC